MSQLMGSLNWASGLIPLGRLYLRPLQGHYHSLGLTDRFTPPRRSDPLVLASLLRQWQDLRFLTSGIPIRTFQADLTICTDASTQGWGAHMGDSKISGTWTRTDRKLLLRLCVEHPLALTYHRDLLSQQDQKVVPSARMEALMRHYKASGISEEVSRLAAAPRRPSTNRMYDDRWLRFAQWAAGQGFDPLDPTAAR